MDKRSINGARSSGFSLIELLVVLAIMGLLASLVGPRLFTQVDRSKMRTAQAQARSIRTSLDALRLDIGRYPSNDEGLSLLVEPPQDQNRALNWFGPYLDGEVPLDPWGNPFNYAQPETDARGIKTSPKVISFGADGEPGGAGVNQDIEV
ncbi:MAG: type II secretion system major pseudopilin GspG [Pseudomonadota bacterium]